MSRLPLTLIAAFSFLLATSAQEPSTGKQIPWANKFFTGDKSPPPPVILQDFGTLPSGTIKTYRFKMSNIYAHTMQVKAGNPSCGCVSIIEYTGKMEPRETGHVDIKVDTSRVDGQKNVKIPIRFDARDPKTGVPYWSEAELEVRVNSRQDIAIKPGSIEFGIVPMGQKAAQTATILYSGRQANWEIKEFGYKKEMFEVKVEPIPVRGGVGYKVTASLKANVPAGAFEEQIVLKTNDDKTQTPVLTLNMIGTVQAPITVVGADPNGVVKMNGVAVGKKLEKSVILQSQKAFKIKSVDGQGDGISVSLLPLDATKSQAIPITFAPVKVGPVKKVLTVKTDTGETVTITVEGIGTEP